MSEDHGGANTPASYPPPPSDTIGGGRGTGLEGTTSKEVEGITCELGRRAEYVKETDDN